MTSTTSTTSLSPSIKQIFFDCDNTLVSTETIAVEAASSVINKVLSDQGLSKSHSYTTEQLLYKYFGMTARQMIVELQKELDFSLTKEETAAYTKFEEDLIIDLLYQNPRPCEGIQDVLARLLDEGRSRLAVVSSSPIRRIRAALEACGIAKYFDHDQVFSAKSSMPTPKSKPDPAIYQWAMVMNDVTPAQCIAFEDSRSGARSAIDAGIATVAYVGAYGSEFHKQRVAETLMEEGCKVVMREYSGFFDCLKTVEGEIERRGKRQEEAIDEVIGLWQGR
ncbi:hypothetical protein PMZ80_005966 [Knufia obscura]|uniref:Uncharacterized protein n=1 Tax=Knufia obscura TaxID=1635080 RepID=A0ABR0RN34_9EURO|nr:hypothetical protein PMZ80_005966 [Knufia obscura]